MVDFKAINARIAAARTMHDKLPPVPQVVAPQVTGLYCGCCGEPQFDTDSGVVCGNGHGGAFSIDEHCPHPLRPDLTILEAQEAKYCGAMADYEAEPPKEVVVEAPPAPEVIKLPPMTEEQQAAYDLILGTPGHFFLTGDAGTGKSFLLKHIMETGRCKATATTARAALHVGGCTIDKLMCFRRDSWEIFSMEKLQQNMEACPPIIAIDEASMIGTNMGRIVLRIANQYRKKLLLVGDLAQASPVKDDWLVNSPLFREVRFVKLTESHRQTDDAYRSVLNKLRKGVVDDEVRNTFSQCMVQGPPDSDEFVRLFATNSTTDAYNLQRLHMLPADNRMLSVDCEFIDDRQPYLQKSKPIDETQREKLIQDGAFAHKDSFRIGARVLGTKNDQGGLFVNGDIGWITDIKLKDGSSVKDLPPFNPFKPEATSPEVEAFIVKFDRHEMETAVVRDFQSSEDAMGQPAYTLHGFPLRLGWAITIHRAQGMTVDKAYLDMNTITFMPGESRHGLAYVGLSRTRELSGLKISNWRDDAILCAETVKPYV